MVKIGVVSDTHVKDRVQRLHPQVLSIFEKEKVSLILHAGDICNSQVIRDLEVLAPVYAVRGNADVLSGFRYPMTLVLTMEGVRIAMTHGQGSFFRYLRDRIRSVLLGPTSFYYFEEQSVRCVPADVDVVIFGHIHAAVNRRQNGQLLFNPGSASLPIYKNQQPSVGILTVDQDRVNGEIVFLDKLQDTDLTLLMRIMYRIHRFFGNDLPGLGGINE